MAWRATQIARPKLNAPVAILACGNPERIELVVHSVVFVTAVYLEGEVHLVLTTVHDLDRSQHRMVPSLLVQNRRAALTASRKVLAAVVVTKRPLAKRT